jgi:hypothetical protein
MLRYILQLVLGIQLTVCSFSLCLNAQDSLFNITPIQDSIILSDDSRFIYNSLKISYKGTEKKDILIIIGKVIGWRLVSDSIQRFTVTNDKTILFPITISKTKYSPSIWSKVPVMVYSLPDSSISYYEFYIKTKDFYSFSLMSSSSELVLSETQKSILFPFLLKNESNSKQEYQILFRNSEYGINKKFRCVLEPGQDTIYTREIDWPQNLSVGKICLQVDVSDTTGMSKVILCNLFKEKSSFKVHKTKHEILPIELETGYYKLDQQLSYYWGMSGNLKFKKSDFDFKFRTKTLGIANTIEKNMFIGNWNTQKWSIGFGQLSDFSSFYSYGPGMSVLFNSKTTLKMGIQFIGRNDKIVYTGNMLSSFVSYKFNKIIIKHSLIFNHDYNRELSSWLQKNDFVVKNTDQYKLVFNFGVGVDKRLGDWNRLYSPGLSIGYKYYKQINNLVFQSDFQRNQIALPGIDKGLFTQFHSFNWQKKNFTFGSFYQYNKTVSTLFRDTIFQADISRFNNRKFGFRFSQYSAHSNRAVAFGWYRQLGQSGFLVPKYLFTDLSYSISVKGGFRLQFSSMNGMSNKYKQNKILHFTSSSLTVGYHKIGIKSFYIQNPIFSDREGKLWSGYTKTMLYGGYFSFNFWRYYSAHFSGTISKSLYDQRKSSNVSINLRYNNTKRNLLMEWSGNIPIVKSNAPGLLGSSSPVFIFSLRKTLNLPNIFKKSYHNLKLTAFNDLNQNNLKDDGEIVLPNIDLLLGDLPMKTDSIGQLKYLNADTGVYKIQMLSANPVPGLTPLFNRDLSVNLNKDTIILLPFRKIASIKGRVIIGKDSISSSNFDLGNIRVTAIDSFGHEFATLTNGNGEYTIELPASNYIVSLNPKAFGDAVKPIQFQFSVDMTQLQNVVVNFELLVKHREMRLLKK